MARKRTDVETTQKMLRRREFVEAFLMEFPTATRSKVAEAWKKKGNRSAIAKDEFDWARRSVKGNLDRSPFSLSRHLVQPRRRRMRREQSEAEAKKLKQLHPVGKEVTASALKKLYDAHFADVLGAVIKPSSSGSKSQKFKVVKPLPSPDTYCDLREQHFTKTISKFVADLREPIQEGVENIDDRLDNMSDSAREGERGQDAEEASSYLEGVLDTLAEDAVPHMIRTLSMLWIPEPTKGRSSRETESALKQIRFLKEHIQNRCLSSLRDMAALLPTVVNARTASSAIAKLENAEPDISGYADSLDDAADDLQSAIDSCPRSLP